MKELAGAVDAAIATLNDAADAFVQAQLAANQEEHRAAVVAGRQPGPGVDPLSILRAAVASQPNLARWLELSPRNPAVTIANLYPET